MEHLYHLHHENQKMQKRLSRIKSKLDQVLQLQAVDVDKVMAGDLKTIMEEEEEQIFGNHLEKGLLSF